MSDEADQPVLTNRSTDSSVQLVLKACQTRLLQGQKEAILDAVLYCSLWGIAMPKWLATAFQDGYTAARVDYAHRSWDEVFGSPQPKNRKLANYQWRSLLSVRINERISEIKKQFPIDEAFEIVAKEFSISPSLANKLYYAHKTGLKKLANELFGPPDSTQIQK